MDERSGSWKKTDLRLAFKLTRLCYGSVFFSVAAFLHMADKGKQTDRIWMEAEVWGLKPHREAQKGQGGGKMWRSYIASFMA